MRNDGVGLHRVGIVPPRKSCGCTSGIVDTASRQLLFGRTMSPGARSASSTACGTERPYRPKRKRNGSVVSSMLLRKGQVHAVETQLFQTVSCGRRLGDLGGGQIGSNFEDRYIVTSTV